MIFEYLGSFLRFILGRFLRPMQRVPSNAVVAQPEEATPQPKAADDDVPKDTAPVPDSTDVLRVAEADLVYASEIPVPQATEPSTDTTDADVSSTQGTRGQEDGSAGKEVPGADKADKVTAASDAVTFEVGPYKVVIDDIQVNLF